MPNPVIGNARRMLSNMMGHKAEDGESDDLDRKEDDEEEADIVPGEPDDKEKSDIIPGEPDDEEADEESTSSPTPPAAADKQFIRGRRYERARITSILEAPAANGKGALALHLALNTSTRVEDAATILAAAAPETGNVAGDRLDQAMRQFGGNEIGGGDDEITGQVVSIRDRAMSRFSSNGSAASSASPTPRIADRVRNRTA